MKSFARCGRWSVRVLLILPTTRRIEFHFPRERHVQARKGSVERARSHQSPPRRHQSLTAATRHQQKQKNQADSCEDADGKETLLAFSYLFVPLLVLGMEGEKERKQVIGVLTLKANS